MCSTDSIEEYWYGCRGCRKCISIRLTVSLPKEPWEPKTVSGCQAVGPRPRHSCLGKSLYLPLSRPQVSSVFFLCDTVDFEDAEKQHVRDPGKYREKLRW